uniref:Flavanone 4-reductase n=1 Tax=Dendrobium hybrid cultivar TaxID=136990 RepID=Q5XQ45_9ASPA|nr:putative dihyroflavonol 4-reductase [Dendrobium hybrid cultivar]ACJ54348.1 dihydroflavonol-4-reductase [Dendrobium hybrid cultivar]
MENEKKGPVVVTGASGYVGSWLVMKLLKKGYVVRATVRDPTNLTKVKPLLDLPRSNELLSIWKADLDDVEGSFDEVIRGSIGVFHVATPMNFQSKDPENEVIKPAINGLLGILRSCKKAGSVQRVIFTSSAGTVNVEEHQAAVYDESCWSDLDFVNRVKMTGWMYFLSKTLAEKAAWEFVKDNDIHLITIIPTLVVGSFITSEMPPSMITALSLITGNDAHYSILKQVQFVHLDDVCDAHIFLFEHPKANGRYICSSYDSTIYGLAEMLKNRYPTYVIPQKFKEIDPDIKCVSFSSKKLLELGFKYKYSMEEMFDDAINTCRDKKLIPLNTDQEIVLAAEKFEEVKEQIAVK